MLFITAEQEILIVKNMKWILGQFSRDWKFLYVKKNENPVEKNRFIKVIVL